MDRSLDCMDDGNISVSLSVNGGDDVCVEGWSDDGFSISKPNETSFNWTSTDLFRKTTGGGFDCRLSDDDSEEEDEWDDKRGDDCSGKLFNTDDADGWETGCEGGEIVFVFSSFVVVETNGFTFESVLWIVERIVPFRVDDDGGGGWKRRLSLVLEDDEKRDNGEFVSWRRSFVKRRRCVTVTNGSEVISLYELFNIVDDNENESLSSLAGDILRTGSNHSGNDVSPFY